MNKLKNRKWKNTVAPIPISSSSLQSFKKLNLFKSKSCVSCCHEGVESCWTTLNWTRRTRSAPNHNELDYIGSCFLRQLKWNWFETSPPQATRAPHFWDWHLSTGYMQLCFSSVLAKWRYLNAANLTEPGFSQGPSTKGDLTRLNFGSCLGAHVWCLKLLPS